jgi:hypothetical protein
MKYSVLVIALGLVTASCDSIDQSLVTDETLETAYQTSQSESGDALLSSKRKPKPGPEPEPSSDTECWTDLADLVSQRTGTPASVDRSDERGNEFIIVKDLAGNKLYGVSSPGHLIGKGHTFACRPDWIDGSGEIWGKKGGGGKTYTATKALVEASLEPYGFQ